MNNEEYEDFEIDNAHCHADGARTGGDSRDILGRCVGLDGILCIEGGRICSGIRSLQAIYALAKKRQVAARVREVLQDVTGKPGRAGRTGIYRDTMFVR